MSNDLTNINLEDLVDRYNSLIDKYVPLAIEIAPLMEKFGKYRQELQIISAELVKRGFNASEPEKLFTLVEEEIRKRDA
jgi:hypothetical protein